MLIVVLSISAVSAQDNATDSISLQEESDVVVENDYMTFGQIIENANVNDTVELDAIYKDDCVQIDKSLTLTGNASFENFGLDISSGEVTIKNLKFNMSRINAGNEKLNLINCTFLNYHNHLLRFEGNALTITDCTFKDSQMGLSFHGKNILIVNSVFENINSGPIDDFSEEISIINSTFIKGDADSLFNYLFLCNKKLAIVNNSFQNVGFRLQDVKEAIVENNVFDSSSLIYDSQEISFKCNKLINSTLSGTNIILSNCDFISSTSEHCKCKLIENCNFINITTDEKFLAGSDEMTIDNCTFVNNTIFPFRPFYEYSGSRNVLQIKNSKFLNNIYTLGKWVIYEKVKVIVDNSSFIDNQYTDSIFLSNNIAITNSRFINNYANKTYSKYKENNVGLITFNNGKLVLRNNIFANNTDMFLFKAEDPKSLDMTNNIIEDNFFNGTFSEIFIRMTGGWGKEEIAFISNSNITNNFYGLNLKSNYEIMYGYPFFNAGLTNYLERTNYPDYANLVNLILEKNSNVQYCLKFVDDNNNLVKMPTNTYSIKQGDITIENIKVENGIGVFTSEEELFPDKTYILTKSSSIVNKAPANVTVSLTGPYYHDDIIISLKNGTQPIANKEIGVIFYLMDKDYSDWVVFSSDNDGNIRIKYNERFSTTYVNISVIFPADNDFGSYYKTLSYDFKSMKITPVVSKMTVKYGESRNLQVNSKEFGSYKNSPGWIYKVKIYKKSNNKLVHETFGYGYENGITINDDYGAGQYKVVISSENPKLYNVKTTTTILTVNKAPTTVKAPKLTAKYKKTSYFQVTIKSKVTNKLLKNTYVKIKIDKTTYKIKTNSKGIAKFNTKNLKVGKHNVVISSGDNNYIMSGKSTITIKR